MASVTSEKKIEWKMLWEHGDLNNIIKENPGRGFTRYKVRKAIQVGEGHFEIMNAVTRFYNRRKKQQEKISNQ